RPATYAERQTANPERPARNSARTPRGRPPLLASIWRGLLGFAGLASHIRPLFAPNPSCNVPGVKILPTTHDTTAVPCYCSGKRTRSKTQSIEKKILCVKSLSARPEEKLSVPFGSGSAMLTALRVHRRLLRKRK